MYRKVEIIQMQIQLNGEQALAAAIEEYYQLPKYQYIMDNIFRVDLSGEENEIIRKYFNGYYNIRRNNDWLNNYYKVFEKMKLRANVVTFEEILEEISQGDMLEPSYASKMLATLNPEKPILDSRVKSILQFNIQGNTRKERKECIIKIYHCMEETYKSYLESAEGKMNIELFDRIIGYKYPLLSQMRKIDFMIWGLGALQEDIFVKMLEVKPRD